MTLIELIKQETAGSRPDLILVAGLAGVANAGLLALTNSAIREMSTDMESFRYLLLFAIAFALYAICFRRTSHRLTVILEGILTKLRLRIAQKIRQADLLSLESIEQAEIYNLVTSEARVISEASGVLAAALQSSLLLTFAVIYMALLSLPAFVFCLSVIGIGIWTYLRRLREVNVWIQRTLQQEIHSFNTIRDLIDGFKEVKINDGRSRDLMADITESAEMLRAMKIKTADMFNINFILANSVFYLTIAGVLFLLPRFISFHEEDMVRVMMTLLFIIGPLGIVVSGIQALSKSNVAVHNIALLEQRLDRFAQVRRDGAGVVLSVPQDFREIQLQEISFAYVDHDGNEIFRVGPLDLAIKRGEILFVMGGNGSGKTTFLKLLTALYAPTGGRLLVDKYQIEEAALKSYRGLFAAIFADFHLFRKLYGLYNVREETVQKLLTQFQLEQKTAFAGDHFTNIQLSTGQRKRLALIVALLEDRPIYVFDEWAADQDPEFRRYFYEQLLPDLAAQGKTIVAVTHDERYLHVAHRVITMEFGRIERITRSALR
ncbi:MAG TPA: cyclic peptide export ABC transporter [Alphaproteobacteria bacterium]|nr:cyclic peptide export ABC transporter [Alphaproteobacteria bacterium]